MDPPLQFTFYTEATTDKVIANGPRIADRTGTTTVYLASTSNHFSNPDSFRSGTPVQVSSLRQQVIVDTSTGAFNVVNINIITAVAEFLSDGRQAQLGEAVQAFRTFLNRHLKAPGNVAYRLVWRLCRSRQRLASARHYAWPRSVYVLMHPPEPLSSARWESWLGSL